MSDQTMPVLSMSDFVSEARMTSGDNINYRTCPVCGCDEWKVYVNPRKGVYVCFKRCNAGGRVVGTTDINEAELVRLLHRLEAQKRAEPEIELKPIDPPHTFPLTTGAETVLISRYGLIDGPSHFGIRTWLTEDEKIKYVTRFFIPFYNHKHQLIAYSGRRVYDYESQLDVVKYRNNAGPRAVYVPWYCPGAARAAPPTNLEETLFIVEGPFDAMRLWQHGYCAVALGGKTVPSGLRKTFLTTARYYGTLVVLLDLDAEEAAFDLFNLLRDYAHPTAKVIMAELSGKDPCSLPTDQLESELRAIIERG